MDKKTLLDYWKRSEIIRDEKVLSAFEKVPREKFVLPEYKMYAYVDEPQPIGLGQTISQPTTVAIMTQALEPKASQKILEIGAGSGYQAAILSKIIGAKGKVFTIERIKSLYEFAKKNLKDYKNVEVMLGDGSKGLEKEKPFDRIIITAAAKNIPEKLFGQLREGGILVVPVNALVGQRLLKVRKIKSKMKIEDLGAFVFVPLIENWD